MKQSIRLLFPVLVVLSVGCTGTRHAAKYAWLRKQGPVLSSERPLEPRLQTGTPTPASAELIVEQDQDPLASLISANAFALDFRKHPLSGTTVMDPALMYSAPAPATHLNPTSEQDSAYYSAEPRRWNLKALSALPIALTTVIVGIASQSIYLLLIGGAIAFVLGLIGSRQCRDRGDRGKGFAIAGMALGAAALFFSLMVLIWAA